IPCLFKVETRNFDQKNREAYGRALREAKTDKGFDVHDARSYDALAKEYGYYERAIEVFDNHTLSLELPGGIFRNSFSEPSGGKQRVTDTGEKPSILQIKVQCDDPSQYIGMARYDLYLRLDDPSGRHDQGRFALNFFKGAFGLWLRMCLVIALGTTF